MKILVLGSSGFLGKNFINLKKKTNNSYYYFSNSTKKWAETEFFQCDLNNQKKFEAKIKKIKPNLCIDLSWHGIPDYSKKNNEINLSIKKKIYKTLIKNSCKKIITIGSCWEYGDCSGIKKESEVKKSNANDFAKTKLKVLKILDNYHKKKIIDYVWLRLFFVYGIYGKKTSLLESLVKKFKKNQKFTPKNKNSYNDFIYINDVIRYIDFFVSKKKFKSGVYNLGYGKSSNNNDFVETFNKLISNKQEVFKYNYSTKLGLISNMSKTNKYTKIKPIYNIKKGLKDYLIRTELLDNYNK